MRTKYEFNESPPPDGRISKLFNLTDRPHHPIEQTDKINAPHNTMKTNAKTKSSQPRKPQPPLYIPSPRFILVPFFGQHLRAVLEGRETWHLREDVLQVLSMNEAPYWNRRLFPNQRRTALVPDGNGGATRHQFVSEAGFYKLLCLSRNNFGQIFKAEGGSRIFDMPGPDEYFDAEHREFFRNILRELHASWRQYVMIGRNIDEWEMPRRGKPRTFLLN